MDLVVDLRVAVERRLRRVTPRAEDVGLDARLGLPRLRREQIRRVVVPEVVVRGNRPCENNKCRSERKKTNARVTSRKNGKVCYEGRMGCSEREDCL